MIRVLPLMQKTRLYYQRGSLSKDPFSMPTSNMRVTWTRRVISLWTMPGLTRSASDDRELGQFDDKWATPLHRWDKRTWSWWNAITILTRGDVWNVWKKYRWAQDMHPCNWETVSYPTFQHNEEAIPITSDRPTAHYSPDSRSPRSPRRIGWMAANTWSWNITTTPSITEHSSDVRYSIMDKLARVNPWDWSLNFHPKSNTPRLYTSHKEGRWCLVSVKAILLDETQNIHWYISKMTPKDELLRKWSCKRHGRKTKQRKCHNKTRLHMGGTIHG